MLYDAIASSAGVYNTPVDPAARSLMNVPFTIPSNPDLEKEFISQAAKHGMVSVPAAPARVCWCPLLVSPVTPGALAPPKLHRPAFPAPSPTRRSSSRATAAWAACARPSTTACRWRACSSWWRS